MFFLASTQGRTIVRLKSIDQFQFRKNPHNDDDGTTNDDAWHDHEPAHDRDDRHEHDGHSPLHHENGKVRRRHENDVHL